MFFSLTSGYINDSVGDGAVSGVKKLLVQGATSIGFKFFNCFKDHRVRPKCHTPIEPYHCKLEMRYRYSAQQHKLPKKLLSEK